MKNHVTIALLGYGVVGSGTMQLLSEHEKDIRSRVGAPVRVKWVLSRGKKTSPHLKKGVQQTTRWQDIVDDPDVDCIVELMGGVEPARKIIVSALKAGKHVITANKAVLSRHWDEIFNEARSRRKLVYFEAAVGGGVPMVQALNEGLAGNEIHKLVGILNGTTNFILTKMQESRFSFKEALSAAQKAGFAESNPSFDVDGIDTAQKIAILGSLATGRWISPTRVHIEGIKNISEVDIKAVRERLRCMIKLLGIAEKTSHGWVFRVHPALVPVMHPFANVRNEYNALMLHGNAVGDVMLYGKGAGRLPTSSAVLSDIIFLCRQIANGTAGKLPFVTDLNHRDVRFADMSRVVSCYYLRVSASDQPGVLSKVTGILSSRGVSIASVHQGNVESSNPKKSVSIVLLTHPCSEKSIQSSVKTINALPAVKAKTVLIRMAP